MKSINIPFDGAHSESFALQAIDCMPLVAAYIDRELRYRFINPSASLPTTSPL